MFEPLSKKQTTIVVLILWTGISPQVQLDANLSSGVGATKIELDPVAP